jgi:hypothetical protein
MTPQFNTKQDAVEAGYTPCHENKVYAWVGHAELICRDLDQMTSRNQFGYSFGLFRRTRIENPSREGDYIYEYSECLLQSVSVWLTEDKCATGKPGCVAGMFPPRPLSFFGECLSSPTRAERALALVHKLRMSLRDIAAEFGEDYDSILKRCNERQPQNERNIDFAREISDVLAERGNISKMYHPELFPPADLITQTEAAQDRGISPQAINVAIRTGRLTAYPSPDAKRHRPGDRLVRLEDVRRVWPPREA